MLINSSADKKIYVILPAGGLGSRFSTKKPKQYWTIGGEYIINICIKKFLGISNVEKILIPANNQQEMLACLVEDSICKQNLATGLIQIVEGGKTRQESVFNALSLIDEEEGTRAKILVHDVARIMLSVESIQQFILKASTYKAAVLAKKVTNTIKKSSCKNEVSSVIKTLDRDYIWSVETPQFFEFQIIKAAFENAYRKGFNGTDCASVLEFIGEEVNLIDIPEPNIKITYPDDLNLVELWINFKNGI